MNTNQKNEKLQFGRRNFAGFAIFFTIFNSILLLLEYWIWRSYEMDMVAWPALGRYFNALMLVGALSIPLAFIVGLFAKSGRSNPVSWIGFIWLGSLMVFIVPTLAYNFFPNQISGIWALNLSLFLSLVALYIGCIDPKVKTYQIEGFPDLAGLRIVQLTDVHLGMLYIQRDWWGRQIRRVNELKPSIIAITGDLVEGSFASLESLVDMSKDLKAPHRFFVTGNHEYIHGGEVWSRKMRELGWTALHNENRVIEHKGHPLLIAGVPDRMVKRFGGSGESLPDVALKTDRKVVAKILLAHEPASVRDCHTEHPDFIFSGHTHGGQIWPFSLFVRLQQPVISGWKTIRGTRVYASCGTGFWGPPMRLGTRSEITVFDFK